MNPIRNPRKFTPLGIFMHEYCKKSNAGHMVMNYDYLVYDYKLKRVMVLEEKCGDERMGDGQFLSLRMVDDIHRFGSTPAGMDYWGVFTVRLPAGCTHVGPGVTLNGVSVTVEQLVRHLNFTERIVSGWNPRQSAQQSFDSMARKEFFNGHT